MALGLAAGVILLGQLTYNKDLQAELEKAPAASSDSGKQAEADIPPVAKPSIYYRLIPHRELVKSEALFDGILCALALPAGICFFVMGTLSGPEDPESDQ
jgi:hypothetical protein